MRLAELVDVSRSVAETSGRLEKIDRLASLLNGLEPDEIEIAIAFLSGSPRQGRIGVGGAVVAAAHDVEPSPSPTLSLEDVDGAFERLASASGPGSASVRGQMLRDLFGRATREEQEFLVRLIFGELRQGALEGVLLEAVPRASGIAPARVRRAAMLAGALAPVARAALPAGNASDDALSRFMIQLFQPVQPMLADSADDVDAALGELGEASLEYKLDGARIQVHKAGDDVRVFSRNLRDVSAAVPEVIEIVRALPARELILDGEVLALRPDGTPHPFQTTMRRFGRKLDVEAVRGDLPVTPFFFDLIHLDGTDLFDAPALERAATLSALAPALTIPRLVTADPAAAEAFFDEALARGHEGVMAKAPASLYEAGSRGV